jgi:hypothetical protein
MNQRMLPCFSSMNNTNENPTANQFQNWSIIHFDTLVDMYETFQQDCPDSEQSLDYFIQYMYENAQDVVATWHNPNKYENN